MRTGALIGRSFYAKSLDGQIIGYSFAHVQTGGTRSTQLCQITIDDRLPPETIDAMVIDHANRLHMGVADSRADKLKTPLPEIVAQRIGLATGGRVIL